MVFLAVGISQSYLLRWLTLFVNICDKTPKIFFIFLFSKEPFPIFFFLPSWSLHFKEDGLDESSWRKVVRTFTSQSHSERMEVFPRGNSIFQDQSFRTLKRLLRQIGDVWGLVEGIGGLWTASWAAFLFL